MALTVKEKYAKKRLRIGENKNTLERIIERQANISKGKAMMYVAKDEADGKKVIYTTRGEHSYQVAKIGVSLAKQFGGDDKKAYLIGLAHDFGHSVLAHTGEAALGRFLYSPDKFLEDEDYKPRKSFDHSKHGVVALKKICKKYNIDVPFYLENGIEAHSTGSDSKGSVICESFEAECIMRADKIASSISDTNDMVKSGALHLSEESLRENFNNNPDVKRVMKQRLFGNFEKDANAFKEMLLIVKSSNNDYSTKLKNFKQGNNEIPEVLKILNEYANEQIDMYIEKIKDYIQLPVYEQLERMTSLIIDGVKRNGKKIDVSNRDDYTKIYPNGQLYITKEAEAILGGLRGLLEGKENKRTLGKMGSELEGLVETVARFIYKNKSEFEHTWPFKNWKEDPDGNEYSWEKTVAYGIAQMKDGTFKRFAKRLLEREDAREELKSCKYRDPRDKVTIKKYGLKNAPFSVYDFSTPESIDLAFEVDAKRKYEQPVYNEYGKINENSKRYETQTRNTGMDR